jgi:hypothetical protein
MNDEMNDDSLSPEFLPVSNLSDAGLLDRVGFFEIGHSHAPHCNVVERHSALNDAPSQTLVLRF